MATMLPSDVLAANQRAMKLLGDGEMDASHRLLTSTLAEAEKMVTRIPPPVPASSSATERGADARQTLAQQEVLLAYSVTLNNLGCQLRREDQLEAALDNIQKASEVECALFGKPACSTMLNLSSVLVGMGRSDEALPIAKSCVLAAQGGEPTLLITALHNLAVALGQQSGKRERQLALTTMLRALREAEDKLGPRHPTTLMLREKCGMTDPWIAPHTEGRETSTTTSLRRPSPPPTPPTPRTGLATTTVATAHGTLSARERGRNALATLNFGSPQTTPLLAAETTYAAAAAANSHSSSHSQAEPRTPPNRKTKKKLSAVAGGTPLSRAPPRDLPPLPEVRPTELVSADTREASAPQPSATSSSASLSHPHTHAPRSNASMDEHPVAVLAVQQRPSVLMGQSLPTTGNSLPSLHAERRTSSVPLAASHSAVDTAAVIGSLTGGAPPQTTAAKPVRSTHTVPLSGSKAVDPTGAHVPRYMRFAPHDTALSPGQAPTATTTTTVGTAHGAETAPTNVRPITDLRVLHSVPANAAPHTWRTAAKPVVTTPAVAQTMPAPAMDVHRSVFHHNPADRRARETFRQHRQVEEDAFRRLRHRRTAEREAEAAFQAKREALEARRDARAAVTIQKAWRHWWHLIGHPRFLLQQRQAEERRRRRAERLALEARGGSHGDRARGKSQRLVSTGVDETQRVALLRRAVPACVAACATTWLQKTACRRYLVRRKYPALPRYIRERQVAHAVVRLQALFRGRRVRQAQALHSTSPPHTGMASCAVDPQEEREYAAMVIQRAYRTSVARRTRQRLHVERYEEPTRQIQAWLRATVQDHRARGVDALSVHQREAAALTIQRAWRGYSARLAYLMYRLRAGIQQTRVLETKTRLCLQRLGRGFLARRGLGQLCAVRRAVLSAPSLPDHADDNARATQLVSSRTPAPARWTELVIPRTAYEAECLTRAPALAREREDEREQYDIHLYAGPQAERERLAWSEALRLRPTQVARRRADEDLRTELEAHTVLRDRAASKIQRLFREWHRHFHNVRRDRDLLLRSRGLYQQKELEIKFQRQQRAKVKARGVALVGRDATEPVRAYRDTLQQELEALEAVQPVAVETVRTQPERHYDEAAIQRDEHILRVTYPADLARLREDMDERRAATGKVYEHPYYRPYPNDEFRMTLGID